MNFKMNYLLVVLVLVQFSTLNAKTPGFEQKDLIKNIKSQLELYIKFLNGIKQSKIETADDETKTKLRHQLISDLFMEKVGKNAQINNLQRFIDDMIQQQQQIPQMKQIKVIKSALEFHSNGTELNDI